MKVWECSACGGNSFTRLDARTVKCDYCETRFALEEDETAGQSDELIRARVLTLMMQADRHHEKGEHGKVIEVLTQALELDENNSDAWTKLGRAYRQSQLYDDALRCYQKALQLDPNNGSAYGNSGVVYMYKGDLQNAIRCLKHSLTLLDEKSSLYATMLANFGIVMHKAGNQQEAIRLINEAEQHGYERANNAREMIGVPRIPNAEEKKKAESLVQKADKLYAENKYADAVPLYQEALKLNDRESGVWTKLGRVFRLTGEPDKAMRCYQKALEINPKDGSACGNIGVLYHQSGKYVEAIRQYNKALAMFPANSSDRATMTANLAQATYLSGDRRKGERLLSEAERLGYANGDAVRKKLGIKPGLFGNLFK